MLIFSSLPIHYNYMKLCVDRDLNCGWQLVTWSCV